jgi:TonB family protein
MRGEGALHQGLDAQGDAVSMAPGSLPEAVIELLPPGIRSTFEGDSVVPLPVEEDAFPGPRVVERIENPFAGTGGPAWLEVEYTVDAELDERVRGVLERSRIPLGHVVLLDPATGAVFSYVSTDPEVFPATRTYPSASLMKMVTAAAVLEKKPEAAGRDCHYVGSPYRFGPAQLQPPATGGEVQPFWRAIAFSNNQCFARLAVHDVGEKALLAEMHRLGLLESPAPRHPAARVDPIEDSLDLGHLGSGLAGSFITPLAAARLAAVLAKGELVQPYWIARVRDGNGTTLTVPQRQPPSRVWPPQVTDELRELMVGVIEHGTARSAFRDDQGAPLLGSVRVSGKTGSLTGFNPTGRYQWFVGVAPAETPRVAIATLVVNGPLSAAEVAAATLREVFCDERGCDASHVEQLHARAVARGAVAAPVRTGERSAVLHGARAFEQIPRPIGVSGFAFPSRLLKKKLTGKIVLLLELDETGEVLDVQIDSSDLPDLDEFIVNEVKSWRFTPAIQQGRPVHAKARFPIPINIE